MSFLGSLSMCLFCKNQAKTECLTHKNMLQKIKPTATCVLLLKGAGLSHPTVTPHLPWNCLLWVNCFPVMSVLVFREAVDHISRYGLSCLQQSGSDGGGQCSTVSLSADCCCCNQLERQGHWLSFFFCFFYFITTANHVLISSRMESCSDYLVLQIPN